jgi:hypothetical protein
MFILFIKSDFAELRICIVSIFYFTKETTPAYTRVGSTGFYPVID